MYLLQEYQPADDPAVAAADDARLRAAFPGYTVVAHGELLTLSRLPVVQVRDLPATPAGSGWIDYYRSVKSLRTDLRVGSAVLSVYNVHMPIPLDLSSPFSAYCYRTMRERYAARRVQFAGLTRDLDANPGPVLVAGDFNTSPDMGDMRALTSRLRSAIPANRSFYPTSWNAHWQVQLWRLDWAFTSGQVHVYRYALQRSAGMSDHRAQVLRVGLGDS